MILVVCTGNICRSPMVEAMLRHRLTAAGLTGDAWAVSSAGTLGWGDAPMTDESAAVLREHGVVPHAHTSRRLSADMLDASDVVLGMTREHIWGVTARSAAAEPRAFVLGELARLGAKAGPRRPDEPLRDWVARVDALRDARRMARSDDELADPLGEPIETYRKLADRAEDQVTRLVALLAPPAAD
ncbi:low molecular weight phosphatase family protein [Yinghuangia seranimata]|uniref:arsenate reductase/protein-tyrosine-phosphatase family protein n=1 Tax=Yinghuangia seranimata TaxID=408067 RepID=UPI00248AE59B|nr:low molecular weight phosphatase family protein [Yinghuangia seranimata]MDI2125930.1 low molecular weight phosphatase family protein [Yinghuangia seranimata]